MGPTGCPETSVRNYHYTLRNFPEERRSYFCYDRSLNILSYTGHPPLVSVIQKTFTTVHKSSKKILELSHISRRQRDGVNKFHVEDSQLSGATVQNLVVRDLLTPALQRSKPKCQQNYDYLSFPCHLLTTIICPSLTIYLLRT